MTERETKSYFERRATEEREAAEHATSDRAAQLHRELATHYLALAEGTEAPRPDEAPAAISPKEFRIVP